MWIVALALRRPYTFVVMAIVILLLTVITVPAMPVDIFPEIDIPVVSVIWFYTGMAPQDMADRIVTNSERSITTTVNNIEHQESQSVNGLGIIKIFFRPGTNIQTAIAQVTAISQTTVRSLPPGTTPPLIISYSASTTPIVQLGLSSTTLSEQQLFDQGNNFLRTPLATVKGAATPYPYGGKIRQIQVDLDLPKLRFPDTGSVRNDMTQQMRQLVKVLRSRRGHVVSAILGAGQSDSTLIGAFRERFLKPRRAEAYITLQRGITRGELPANLDLDHVLDALYGPIYMRFMIRHESLTPAFVERTCDMILNQKLPCIAAPSGRSVGKASGN